MTMMNRLSTDALYKWKDELARKALENAPIYGPLHEDVLNELRHRGLPDRDPAEELEF